MLLAAVFVACSDGGTGTDPLSKQEVPPKVTLSAPNAIASLSSGSTVQLIATVSDKFGAVVNNAAISWSSANNTVATVSSTGLVTGHRSGGTTISAVWEGTTGTFAITVAPGTATRLSIRRQPTNAAAGAAFGTQPIVDVLDVAGNVVTTAALPVTASLASGGGTLSGGVVVTSSNGVATFANVSVGGTIGARTVRFSAPSLTDAVSEPFTLEPGIASKLAIRTQPQGAVSGVPLTTQPVVELRDAFDNLATTTIPTPVTVAVATGGGVLSVPIAVSAQGVATFAGLVLSGIIGEHTLQFTAPAMTTVISNSFQLSAGAPVTLGIQTPPAGGGLNGAFTTQPVIALLDNGGNVSTSATSAVTATITAGNGTLTGASSTAVAGVATFSGLGVTGTSGVRTITFASPGLTSVSTTVTPCNAVLPPQLTVISPSPLVSYFQGNPVTETVSITDAAGSCTALTGITTSISYAGAAGWLTANPITSPARVALIATPGDTPQGIHTATVTVQSANGGSAQFTVTLDVRAAITIAYGAANQKVVQLDPAATLRIVPTVLNGAVGVPDAPLQFVSRSPTIASIAADGTITGRVGGQAWLIASTTAGGGATDSIFLNVTRTTGPLLRADVSRFVYMRNVDFSVTLYLDLRGQTAGAAQLIFNWPTINGTPSLLRLNNTVPGTTANPVIVTDANTGTTRISIVSATGLTGLIPLGRFDFTPTQTGSSMLVLRVVELLALDQTSMLDAANALQYPVVIR
jgi:hypothetical protein